MKAIILAVFLTFPTINLASATYDTHPQLCENIRVQISEDCSEDSNTVDRKTGSVIKRNYRECYDQDFASTLKNLNTYLTEELGIYIFDASYENEQIVCAKNN